MTDSNPLTAAVQTQLSITSSFHLWLTRQLEKNPSHGELISKLESRLESYRETLSAFNPTHIGTNSPNEPQSWTLSIGPQKPTGDDKTIRIPVTGPGADDYSEIIAKDEKEASYITGGQYLGYIKRVFQALAQAEKDIHSMIKLSTEIVNEKRQLSRNPEDTVQTHIRLLKEYNDVKDIGQQMIGLIAENKGVRIGSLYENGDYGVTADD